MEVTFLYDVHTHCREQVFYINERGQLRRHDYTAEVVGAWARGAHYCSEYRDFGAGVFATRRVVFPRRTNGTSARSPQLVYITVFEARLCPR